MTILAPRHQTVAFRVLVAILVACAGLTFLPLWAPLVLAVWVAVLVRPLMKRIGRASGGRHRAAGAVLVLLLVGIFVPLIGSVVSLSRGALDLGRTVLASSGAKSALIGIASGSQGAEAAKAGSVLSSPSHVFALLEKHGAEALQVIGGVAGAATAAVIGLFVFFYAVYVFLVDGPGMYAWVEAHVPLDLAQTRRLVAAFVETGRGLFVGVGLTGLAQGIVATTTYLALGVPRALVLGLLTCIASLIPSIGTALVWVPVAIGLALAGKAAASAIMAAVGVLVIATVDNVLRPVFARFGKLELSTFVLLSSIFGGLAIFGAWGFVLGPLFARLAKEALEIVREERESFDDEGYDFYDDGSARTESRPASHA